MLITTTQPLLLRADTLEVTLATTFAELDAALRLRYEVFNLELQEGLRASSERGYDHDAYDAYCEHLIVTDRVSKQVVGTYRLLRQSAAVRHIGSYSEQEFDLPLLKGYLRAGAFICGAPAFDVEFGTADVFVLLETAQMTARYQQHYFNGATVCGA